MNFHQEDGFGMEITAYESEMKKEVALTLFTLYDAYRSFAILASILNISNMSHVKYSVSSSFRKRLVNLW